MRLSFRGIQTRANTDASSCETATIVARRVFISNCECVTHRYLIMRVHACSCQASSSLYTMFSVTAWPSSSRAACVHKDVWSLSNNPHLRSMLLAQGSCTCWCSGNPQCPPAFCDLPLIGSCTYWRLGCPDSPLVRSLSAPFCHSSHLRSGCPGGAYVAHSKQSLRHSVFLGLSPS